jgi:hypothetical protein
LSYSGLAGWERRWCKCFSKDNKIRIFLSHPRSWHVRHHTPTGSHGRLWRAMPDFVVENFVATSSGTHAVTHINPLRLFHCIKARGSLASRQLLCDTPTGTHTHALSSRSLCMVATHKHLTFFFLLSYTSSENSVGELSQRAVFAPSLAAHSSDPIHCLSRFGSSGSPLAE